MFLFFYLSLSLFFFLYDDRAKIISFECAKLIRFSFEISNRFADPSKDPDYSRRLFISSTTLRPTLTDEKIQDAFLPEEIFSEFFLSLTTSVLVNRSFDRMFVNFAAILVDRVTDSGYWANFVQFASLEDVGMVCKNIECMNTYFEMTNNKLCREVINLKEHIL